MQTQTYNGWTNYETWNVALWLGNEEGSYLMCREMAQEAREMYAGNEDETATAIYLADALQALVLECAPELPASMFSDLLNAALSEVNWYEIAQNTLSDD